MQQEKERVNRVLDYRVSPFSFTQVIRLGVQAIFRKLNENGKEAYSASESLKIAC